MEPTSYVERKFAFITTCKNRLHNLKQTLPLMIAERPDEIIVVDYNCEQGTGAWLSENYPQVKVVYVKDGSPFNLSKARNLGILASSADIMCMIDSDILVSPEFVSWVRMHAEANAFYRHAEGVEGRDKETWGSFVCHKDALLKVEMYDEAFDGWGGEDDDIYFRLNSEGFQQKSFPNEFMKAISHGDEERFLLYSEKNRDNHFLVNLLYSDAKKQLSSFAEKGSKLTLSDRVTLRKNITEAFRKSGGKSIVKVAGTTRTQISEEILVERFMELTLKISRKKINQ